EALKHDFDKMNIRLQIINPGFVDTPLTGRSQFRMPGLISVEDASRRMAAAIGSGGFETSFPRRFTWAMKLLRLLPFSLRYALIHALTGWEKQPMAPARKPRAADTDSAGPACPSGPFGPGVAGEEIDQDA